MKYREVMWATMKPDCYSGKNCDRLKPQWEAHAEGDFGGADTEKTVKLAAKTFPPGTKIVISVPCCPSCGESSDFSMMNDVQNNKTDFQNLKCDCGFDWTQWAYDEFS